MFTQLWFKDMQIIDIFNLGWQIVLNMNGSVKKWTEIFWSRKYGGIKLPAEENLVLWLWLTWNESMWLVKYVTDWFLTFL